MATPYQFTQKAMYVLLICISTFTLSTAQSQINQATTPPYVIILSLDGFRWDYPNKYHTPTFNSIAQQGVKATSMQPCFPTITFPNHYAMATGLYPNNNGIVLNKFYCKRLKETYTPSNRKAVENGQFYDGEPIWITAEKQGVKSASFFWVGSEAPVTGLYASYWKQYEEHIPFDNRIDTVISWLTLPYDKRPRLIMWYYHQPDEVNHNYGPDSQKAEKMVEWLDSMVGEFTKRIKTLAIADSINIIVVSDHGFTSNEPKHSLFFDDYVKSNWIDNWYGSNPLYMLSPKAEFADTAFTCLKKMPHAQIWKKSDVPAKFHYGSNERILDWVILADSTWNLQWRGKTLNKGDHGYTNEFSDMQSIFYAFGPDFKRNYVHPSFQNIAIYEIIAHLLRIKPAPNDADFNQVKGLFREK